MYGHFLDCLTDQSEPRTNGWEGLRVLKVLDEATEILKNQKQKESFSSHKTAVFEQGAKIGEGTKIWHFSHVYDSCVIGKNVTIGQNVEIGPDVIVGDSCKIQNNVSLYKGVELSEGVFCGPSCVFTNVNFPRANEEKRINLKKLL